MSDAPLALGEPAARACRASSRAVTSLGLTDRHVLLAGSLLLLLPNILFACRLRLLPAVVLLTGACMYVAVARGRRAAREAILAQPFALSRFGACLVLAVALLILGGEGHLVFSNWDWLWRDSVLADVARGPFPPLYHAGGETFFLRAPLGMYMLPALVAEAAGLGAGHVALLAQNALLLTLVLYLLATIAGRRAVLVLVVFVSFSGLDVVGQVLMWLLHGHDVSSFVLPSHIEAWTQFQYSSVLTQLFWVPNHALPAYWLALLVLLCAEREIEVCEVGIALAASLFWSPFAFIGALPFVAFLAVRDARVSFASARFWLAGAAAACFLPVAFYLKVDAARVPHAFILFQPFMVLTIAGFLLIEIPHVAVIRAVWTRLGTTLRACLTVSIVCLTLLPTVRIGVSDDLVMRASIPALTILAYAFAQALAIAWEARRFALCAAGLALALVGAVTPAMEIVRALTFAPYEISDCNLVTVWKKTLPEQPTIENYLAHTSLSPSWLFAPISAAPLVDQPDEVCWPHLPYPPRFSVNTMSNQMLRLSHESAKGQVY